MIDFPKRESDGRRRKQVRSLIHLEKKEPRSRRIEGMGKRKRCTERRRGVSEMDLSASDVEPSAECYTFRHGFGL